MSKKEEKKEEAAPPDARVLWVQSKLSKAYDGILKADKFAKAFQEPEALARLDDFLNKDDARVLSYYGEALTCQVGIPKKLPKGTNKLVYFLKGKAGKIAEPAAELMVNEMGSEPLEHLEKVLAEIYLPILSNPNNHEGSLLGICLEQHSRLSRFYNSESLWHRKA